MKNMKINGLSLTIAYLLSFDLDLVGYSLYDNDNMTAGSAIDGKYHVFDYLRKILRCYLPMKRPRKASLQLEILFDRKPTRPSGSSSLQCNTSGFCCCQVTTKSTLTVDQLDFTLTRCLLINCCEKLFWDVVFNTFTTFLGVVVQMIQSMKVHAEKILQGDIFCC
jgi:hypothetical protein